MRALCSELGRQGLSGASDTIRICITRNVIVERDIWTSVETRLYICQLCMARG